MGTPQLGLSRGTYTTHWKSGGILRALPLPSWAMRPQVINLFVPSPQFNECWGDFFFLPWHTWKDEVHPSSSSRGDSKPQAKTLPSRLRESPGASLRIDLTFPWQMVIGNLLMEGGAYNDTLEVTVCWGALRKRGGSRVSWGQGQRNASFLHLLWI